MLVFHFFITFTAIFVLPLIIFTQRKNALPFYLSVSYSLCFSFIFSWSLLLFSITIDMSIYVFRNIIYIVFILMAGVVFKSGVSRIRLSAMPLLVAAAVLLPVFLTTVGTGFSVWDSVVSWNEWAVQLFNNEYRPYNAAYPILLPAIWSLFYKVQGTYDMWWMSQILLFVVPFFTLVILTDLLSRSKNSTYFLIFILVLPFLYTDNTYNGCMDMPVMLFGMLSLIMLFSADVNKDQRLRGHDVGLGILFAGLALATKQAGGAFVCFAFIYVIHKRQIIIFDRQFWLLTLLAAMPFISFIILFYTKETQPVGNFSDLQELTHRIVFENRSLLDVSLHLVKIFISLPKGDFIKSLHLILPIITLSLYIFIPSLRRQSIILTLGHIFAVAGFAVWALYFSYDVRNSLWINSFLIITCAISYNHFLNHKFSVLSRLRTVRMPESTISTPLFLLCLVGLILVVTYQSEYLRDDHIYNIQLRSQQGLGSTEIAKAIADEVEGKADCVKAFTGRQLTAYNYALNAIRYQRVVWGGYGADLLLAKFMTHECVGGRFLVFGPWDLADPTWTLVTDLTESGKLIPVGKPEHLIYFVEPAIR